MRKQAAACSGRVSLLGKQSWLAGWRRLADNSAALLSWRRCVGLMIRRLLMRSAAVLSARRGGLTGTHVYRADKTHVGEGE
jgi:hypothetical protein